MKIDAPHVADLHALDMLNAYEIREFIDAAMVDGFYSEECLVALDAQPPTLLEVTAALLAALEHYAVAVPSVRAAEWNLIRYHLARIVNGDAEPLDEIQAFGRQIGRTLIISGGNPYVGSAHDIALLYGLYWEVEELRDADGSLGDEGAKVHAKQRDAILKEAQRWVETHGKFDEGASA